MRRKDALEIAKKLEATKKEGRNHTRYLVHAEGKYVGSFGLPRGSKSKDRRVRWVAEQIGVTNIQAFQLSDCSLSKEDYIAILKADGKLT